MGAIAINTKKLADTQALLQTEQAEMAKEQAELHKARQANQQLVADISASSNRLLWMRWLPFGGEAFQLEQANQKQLQGRRSSAQQWVEAAQANAERRRQQLDQQQQWKATYERRVRGNEYQLRKAERIFSSQDLVSP